MLTLRCLTTVQERIVDAVRHWPRRYFRPVLSADNRASILVCEGERGFQRRRTVADYNALAAALLDRLIRHHDPRYLWPDRFRFEGERCRMDGCMGTVETDEDAGDDGNPIWRNGRKVMRSVCDTCYTVRPQVQEIEADRSEDVPLVKIGPEGL